MKGGDKMTVEQMLRKLSQHIGEESEVAESCGLTQIALTLLAFKCAVTSTLNDEMDDQINKLKGV